MNCGDCVGTNSMIIVILMFIASNYSLRNCIETYRDANTPKYIIHIHAHTHTHTHANKQTLLHTRKDAHTHARVYRCNTRTHAPAQTQTSRLRFPAPRTFHFSRPLPQGFLCRPLRPLTYVYTSIHSPSP